MYTKFRELLVDAEGRNEWVVAINADIRRFSTVMSGDPAQTALYLRAVYGQILDKYFAGRSFFKPTGDGLVLIVPFTPTEAELETVTRAVVVDALRLHDEFARIIEGDKLIKFESPDAIGIGLAVGSVSRLVADDLTLDYTGRPLNVATRLMDLARPSGVVLDSSLDFDAVDADVRSRFEEARVWIKGGPDVGLDVLYTSEPTRIPERYRKPVRTPVRFEEKSERFSREIAKSRGTWWMELTHEPEDRSEIEAVITHNAYKNGKRISGMGRFFDAPVEYGRHMGKPHLKVNFAAIESRLARGGVPVRANTARIDVAYTVDPDVLPAAAESASEGDDIPF